MSVIHVDNIKENEIWNISDQFIHKQQHKKFRAHFKVQDILDMKKTIPMLPYSKVIRDDEGFKYHANISLGNKEDALPLEQIQLILDNLFGEKQYLVQCIEGLKSDYDIQIIKLL